MVNHQRQDDDARLRAGKQDVRHGHAGRQRLLRAAEDDRDFVLLAEAEHPRRRCSDDENEGKQHGVDEIVCLSVNDAFVMRAWGQSADAGDKVTMLADGSADFAKLLGLEADFSKFGMGIRSQRFSMLVKDGVVTHLNIEEPGAFAVSSAEHLMGQLK